VGGFFVGRAHWHGNGFLFLAANGSRAVCKTPCTFDIVYLFCEQIYDVKGTMKLRLTQTKKYGRLVERIFEGA
jgi:hypothetical protein